jgi:hypothetical protein
MEQLYPTRRTATSQLDFQVTEQRKFCISKRSNAAMEAHGRTKDELLAARILKQEEAVYSNRRRKYICANRTTVGMENSTVKPLQKRQIPAEATTEVAHSRI